MRNLIFNTIVLTLLFICAIMWWREASAATGVYTGETVDGLSKICYYHTPRGTVAITIRSHQVCPRSIDV
jgi:hypothetical protein